MIISSLLVCRDQQKSLPWTYIPISGKSKSSPMMTVHFMKSYPICCVILGIKLKYFKLMETVKIKLFQRKWIWSNLLVKHCKTRIQSLERYKFKNMSWIPISFRSFLRSYYLAKIKVCRKSFLAMVLWINVSRRFLRNCLEKFLARPIHPLSIWISRTIKWSTAMMKYMKQLFRNWWKSKYPTQK